MQVSRDMRDIKPTLTPGEWGGVVVAILLSVVFMGGAVWYMTWTPDNTHAPRAYTLPRGANKRSAAPEGPIRLQ